MDSSMKRHSVEEIMTKLGKAKQLMVGGQSQAQVCKELGVSVMTYHRWRKRHSAGERRELGAPKAAALGDDPGGRGHTGDQEEKLQLENARLRRIITDVLLEKVKIEERIALNPDSKSFRRNLA
jgi:putative transposase